MIRLEDRKEGTSMLVLTRRLGEAIRLLMPDGTIATVRVLETHGGKVRLGIAAPASVVILREELVPRPGQLPGGTKGG